MIKGKNIYGHKLVKIPTPRFAVFYNGEERQPEQYEYRLSDCFERPVEKPELELICKVYNINFGKNEDILEKCPFLRDYMTFVDYVRRFHKENGYEQLYDAIERAIDRCIEENVLRDFLIEHRSEVVKVTRLDYTFEQQILLEREDAREEGNEQGQDQLSSMLSWLIASGRNDDVTRAVNDKAVRTELYKEYEKVNPMKN